MSEIPLDIMAAAIRALMVSEPDMVGSVARAILAERERCKKLAANFMWQMHSDISHEAWFRMVGEAVDAIRNPHSSELSSSQALTDMPGEVVPQPASPGANSREQQP